MSKPKKTSLHYHTVKFTQREDGELVPTGEEEVCVIHDPVMPIDSCKELGDDSVIGVHDVRPVIAALDFRRDALLFRRIAVPMLGWQIRNLQLTHHTEEAAAKAAELSWLVEQGILFEPPVYQKLPDPGVAKHQDDSWGLFNKIKRDYDISLTTGDARSLDDAHAKEKALCDLRARFKADQIVRNEGLRACPILNSLLVFDADIGGADTDVLQIVFERIPTPDPLTPWERILEYRQSAESVHGLNGLHVWASEVAKGRLSAADIRNKLSWELETHERYMSANRMEMASGRLEIILTTAAEVIEELVRLKLGKALRTMFALRKHRAKLVKSELTAPGRELAYISRTSNTFRSGSETPQDWSQQEN